MAHTVESVTLAFQREGIQFESPPMWSRVADDDGRAIHFLSPDYYGGHDAQMLIELPYLVGNLTAEQELRLRAVQEGEYLSNYAVRSLVHKQSPRGVMYSLLEYSVTKFERRVPLLEQRILVPVSGSRRMLIVGSTLQHTSKRNVAVFEQFMNSLVCPQ